MKRLLTITMVATVLLFVLAHTVLAQPPDARPPREGHRAMMGDMGRGKGICDIPNLTPEQMLEIKKMKLGFQKEMLPSRTELKIKQLELRSLITGNVAEKEIDAKIDEIGKLRSELQKKAFRHHRQIRELLTDEQKIHFDLRGFGMGHCDHGHGPGHPGCGPHHMSAGKGSMKSHQRDAVRRRHL